MDVIEMQINLYCGKCNLLMLKGTPAVKIDGMTYNHAVCPTVRYRRFAAHKQPDSGMYIGPA